MTIFEKYIFHYLGISQWEMHFLLKLKKMGVDPILTATNSAIPIKAKRMKWESYRHSTSWKSAQNQCGLI